MNEVNNIPEGWVETNIGEVVDLAQGVAINAKTKSVLSDEKNGIPLLKINNLLNNTIDQYANPKLVPKQSIINKNDVIFTRTGQVGAVLFNKYGILHNNSFKVIPKDEIYWKYLYWYLKSEKVYNYVQKVAAGSVQKDLNHSAFKTIEFKYPKDIDEQKSIAAILTSFDDKIELLQAQNKTLEELAQTLFKEWFGKYKVGDELPDGWREGKLGDEFDITIGRTPPRIEQEWFSDTPTGKKWISIKDMGNSGVFIFDTSEYLTDEAISKFNIPIIPENTTLLSFKMTVGKLTITTEEMLSNEAIAHLKIKRDSYLTSEYIYLYLQNLDFNSLGSTSSIVTAINSTIIKNLDFIIPQEIILKDFQEIIHPIFNKIKTNTKQIQTLTKTRDELLRKLMSGEIRVKKQFFENFEELK